MHYQCANVVFIEDGQERVAKERPGDLRIADVTSDVAEQGVDQHEVWSVAVENRVDDCGQKEKATFFCVVVVAAVFDSLEVQETMANAIKQAAKRFCFINYIFWCYKI